MGKSDIRTYQSRIKAVHRYEVVALPERVEIASRRFHFIGAGGVGMSGLAQLMIKNKAIVTGSDKTATAVTQKLDKCGADIRTGHNAENLNPQTDAVVISAAIKEDNPELLLARKMGLKIYKYAQMLGELMNSYEGVAISGTHGKSTTGGWLVYCLKQAGMEPNFIIGAEIRQLAGSSGIGNSKYFVAEACEYDRSFLNLKPKIGCILNIEQDHLDYYRDEAEIVAAFSEFACGLKPGGVLIVNGEDENVTKLLKEGISNIEQRTSNDEVGLRGGPLYETFGFGQNCDWSAQNIRENQGLYSFDVYHNNRLLGKTRISLPGRHNILNGLAAVAIAINMGLSSEQILELLPKFTGMDRRLMFKDKVGGITVLDDYAHHPTEIQASLQAIRQRYMPKRLWCVFQPHQYSRTRFLLDDFAESFKLADVTIVPEIYFVRDSQESKKSINSQMLVDKIKVNGTRAVFINGFGAICDYLEKEVAGGDVVVTMGAGDIWKVADEYLQWLGKNS